MPQLSSFCRCADPVGAAMLCGGWIDLGTAPTHTPHSHDVQKHANACKCPFDPWVLRLELCGEDLLSKARLCRVDRACVAVFGLLVGGHCTYQDDGHCTEELLGLRVLQSTSLVVPTRAFKRQSSDKRAVTARWFFMVCTAAGGTGVVVASRDIERRPKGRGEEGGSGGREGGFETQVRNRTGWGRQPAPASSL